MSPRFPRPPHPLSRDRGCRLRLNGVEDVFVSDSHVGSTLTAVCCGEQQDYW
ncbi:hypothetical protein PENSPDRAFT_651556 [Peniophora sp. CONT]|nr:hypothetical protein PENSPDRAFT_651556 [Peniophora sp. CONT]